MIWFFAVAGSANNKLNQLIIKNRITVQEDNNGQRKSKEDQKCPQSFCAENDEGYNYDLSLADWGSRGRFIKGKTYGIEIHP